MSQESSSPLLPTHVHLASRHPFLPTAPSSLTRHKAAAASGKTVSREDEELLGGRPRPRGPSFLRALLVTFGPGFVTSTCFMLIQDLLVFVNPQLLRSHHPPSCCSPSLGRGWLAVPEDWAQRKGQHVVKEPQPRNRGSSLCFLCALWQWQCLSPPFPHSHPTYIHQYILCARLPAECIHVLQILQSVPIFILQTRKQKN